MDTRRFPLESPFKDFYETKQCLEEIVERREKAWIWLAIEPRSRRVLAVKLNWRRNIMVAYSS